MKLNKIITQELIIEGDELVALANEMEQISHLFDLCDYPAAWDLLDALRAVIKEQ